MSWGFFEFLILVQSYRYPLLPSHKTNILYLIFLITSNPKHPYEFLCFFLLYSISPKFSFLHSLVISLRCIHTIPHFKGDLVHVILIFHYILESKLINVGLSFFALEIIKNFQSVWNLHNFFSHHILLQLFLFLTCYYCIFLTFIFMLGYRWLTMLW